MIKKFLLVVVGLIIVGIAGFAAYAYHRPIAPITASDRPSFSPESVERGRIIAAAGYCATCHTEKGGAPYAGNYPVVTNFGTIYATNLTPDPETGIGSWSPDAFRRAMQQGVAMDGSHLFPAFPYDHFTKMTNQDVDDVYAYLMTEVAPVRQATKETTIPFPMNLRFLQAGWKLLYVDFGRFQPDSAHSDGWNRGAYLVEGVTHCGACHTPRNRLGAEEKSKPFAGASIDGWYAPPLTAANASAVPWNAEAFSYFLKSGAGLYHGVAAGPMAPVVHAGVAQLPDSDLSAIGEYLGDVVGAPESDPATNPVVVASLKANEPTRSYRGDTGQRLYATACASCHYNAKQILPDRPDLGINSSVRQADPSNLLQVILTGITTKEGSGGIVMPGFGPVYSDDDIAAVANYLRTRLAGLEPWPDLPAKVGAVRAQISEPSQIAQK